MFILPKKLSAVSTLEDLELVEELEFRIPAIEEKLEEIKLDELREMMGGGFLLMEDPRNMDVNTVQDWAGILHDNFEVKTAIFDDVEGGMISQSGQLIYLGNESNLQSYAHEVGHTLINHDINSVSSEFHDLVGHPLLEEIIVDAYGRMLAGSDSLEVAYRDAVDRLIGVYHFYTDGTHPASAETIKYYEENGSEPESNVELFLRDEVYDQETEIKEVITQLLAHHVTGELKVSLANNSADE